MSRIISSAHAKGCTFFLLAFVCLVAPASATPITVTASAIGCVDRPATPTNYVWSHTTHFQAVVFHDPIAGCDPTIFERVDWLLEFTVNYDDNGGLRVTSNSANFPTCGRLQFDMHTYLENAILDPYGLISLVVDLGSDCGGDLIKPLDPIPPDPVPEPATLVLVGSGVALLLARRRRRER